LREYQIQTTQVRKREKNPPPKVEKNKNQKQKHPTNGYVYMWVGGGVLGATGFTRGEGAKAPGGRGKN